MGDMLCGCGGGQDENNDHTWDSGVIWCMGVEADRMRTMIILGTRG